MGVTDTQIDALVREYILAIPELFQSRFDVLEHVLCVLGNGYEWRDGVPYYEREALKPWTAETAWRKAFTTFPEMPEIAMQLAQREINASQPVVSTIDRRIHSMTLRAGGMVYPQNPNALLMTIPADVHPAWTDAAAEVREIVVHHGWDF